MEKEFLLLFTRRIVIINFRIKSNHFQAENNFNNFLKKMSTTYQPKKRKRQKTHGFLVRSKTKGGRRIINRRRKNGRKRITP